jgi:uncharacterized membrane protein YsdA (DUF1294 family)
MSNKQDDEDLRHAAEQLHHRWSTGPKPFDEDDEYSFFHHEKKGEAMNIPAIRSAFVDELTKIATELTEEAREHIAKKNFAVSAKASNTGKPAYPIPDKAHARAALGFAAMHHDKKDLAEVRKDVEHKFPGMVHEKHAATLGETLPYAAGHTFLNPLSGSGYGALAGGMMTETGDQSPGVVARGAGAGALLGGGAYALKGARFGPEGMLLGGALGALGGATGGAHAAHAMSHKKKKKKKEGSAFAEELYSILKTSGVLSRVGKA